MIKLEKDICVKCKYYMGTWQRGDKRGIRCKIDVEENVNSRVWTNWKCDAPENCPYVLEHTIMEK